MNQISFSEAEYGLKKRQTRREKFLEQMDQLLPWTRLEKSIKRYYPKAGQGRHPYPLSVMLRVHGMQLFYNLSDPAMEDALYEIESMRRFAGLSITGALPDESTILKFRHLLEKHQLGKKLFKEINAHLDDAGLMLREGTIVDASIISAPTSTKNQAKQRDPEMHQTKKGNEWHFGMKLHIGVDDSFGVIHSLSTTAANVHDITEADQLLHGDEEQVWGDAGYLGIEKRDEHKDRDVEWQINARPGKRKQMAEGSAEALHEKAKASVRAMVEHPFLLIKQIFGYNKVRYRGLDKNTNRLYLLSGFSNLIKMKSVVLA